MSHFPKYFHFNSRCRDSPRTEAYIPCTVALYRVVLTGIWQKYQSSIKVHSPLIYIYKQYSKFRSMICLHYFPLFLPFFQISGFIVVLSLTIYSIYILRSYFWHRHTTNLSIGELWSGPKKKNKFLFYQFVICYIYVHVIHNGIPKH